MIDAAVDKAYNGTRQIEWLEVYAGEKANEVYQEKIWHVANGIALRSGMRN